MPGVSYALPNEWENHTMITNATTTAHVQLKEFPSDDPWEPVDFHYNPAECDHCETMCPQCYQTWAIDHRVALPQLLHDFCRAAAPTAHLALRPVPAMP